MKTKKNFFLSCCLLCMSTLLTWQMPVNAAAKNTVGITKGNTPWSADSTKALPQLLADKLELGKKLEAAKKISDARLREELRMEALEFPAEELYGEHSWSDYVNPFTRGREVEIPASYEIDCNNFVMPVPANKTQVTSRYGYRARFRSMHYGVDLKLQTGDTVYAAFDGKVRIRNYERGYGYYLIIRHPNGLETVYGHLSRQLVKENQIVLAGQPIGLGGNTGYSFGSHLHFETRFMGIAINPEFLFDFKEGAPLNDVFVFNRNKYSRNAYARALPGDGRKNKYERRAATANSSPRVHRVKKGDTLSSLAKRYGTTVTKLCHANGISAKTTLVAGRTALRIP